MKPITTLSILAIEATQGIQCLDNTSGYPDPDNSLELDADKDIAVRVYIGHDGKSEVSDQLSPGLKNARITLHWAATHQPGVGALLPSQQVMNFHIPWSVDINKLRDDYRGSATFILPASSLGKPFKEKVLYLDATVEPPAGMGGIDLSQNHRSIQIGGTDASGSVVPGGLVPHQPVAVQWMLIDYQPKGAFTTGFANPQVAGTSDGLMRKTYPMRVQYQWAGSWLVYGAPSCKSCVAIQYSKMSEWNELLMSLLYAKTLTVPEPDVLIGWLPKSANGPFSVYGLSTNAGAVSWFVEQSKPNRNQVGAAHEVAHAMGVDHVDESYQCASVILEAGFDFETKLPVPANTWDYMSKGGPDGWVSPCVWNKLLGKACNCPGGQAGTGGQSWPLQRTEKPVPAILISGGVDRRQGGQLDRLFVLPSRGPFSVSNPKGKYCLQFLDQFREVLLRHCFDLKFIDLHSRKETDQDGFFFRLRFPSRTRRIILTTGGTILAERSVRETDPDLKIASIQLDRISSGRLAVSWRTAGVDKEALSYMVLFSPDNGKTWSPVAIHFAGEDLEVDLARMRGGDRCRLKVLVSDGFSMAERASETFSIPPVLRVGERPVFKRYLGNRRSKKVHDLWSEKGSCQVAEIVHASHGVVFSSDSLRQSSLLGFRKCRQCFPDSPVDRVQQLND